MERVNPRWRKSSYSANGGADCVETGIATSVVLVRDTKDRAAGPVLRVSLEAWTSFIGSLKR